MVTNPFENLQVATEAAQMQAREQDLSLATTLDTLRATGSGAGGATALAQAALQSKKGVSASIQAQEAQNKKLAAQGEAQTAKMKARHPQFEHCTLYSCSVHSVYIRQRTGAPSDTVITCNVELVKYQTVGMAPPATLFTLLLCKNLQ